MAGEVLCHLDRLEAANELALKLNGHPLRAEGVNVAIHDVLNIYFHPESGEFYADMQR